VLTQPARQICTVANGAGTVAGADVTTVEVVCVDVNFSIGGTVSGLAGTLLLQNNGRDDLTLTTGAPFAFKTRLGTGLVYSVTVLAQPSQQICTVSGGKGTVAAADVTSVSVDCVTIKYAIGGAVSGLTGTLVLQDNGGDDLTVTKNGPFTFATRLPSAAGYAVTVKTQPAGQTCTPANASGKVGTADVTIVTVACLTDNRAPVALVGAVGATLVGSRVTLPGSATDADGDALTYAWTQTSGPQTVALDSATSATPSFLVRRAGIYGFSFVASDGKVLSAPATSTVNVHDVDGGEEFSVALKPDGTVWAWGNNAVGQLGNPGVSASSDVPVRVCAAGASDCNAQPLTGIVAVSAGAAHAIALKSDGTVWTWGENFNSTLGNGDTVSASSATPVQVCAVGETAFPCTSFLTGVVAVSAGDLFTTALLSNGTVVSWGDGRFAELGDGDSESSRAVPVEVCAEGVTLPATCSAAGANILTGVTALASGGGGHTLALKSNGQISAWGYNKNGQVGVGQGDRTASIRVYVPAPVCDAGGVFPCATFLSGVVAVDAWSALSLALKADGTLHAWGHNDYNQLGIDNPAAPDLQCQDSYCRTAPIRVCANNTEPCTQPLTEVAAAVAGRRFALILKRNGTVWTWGDNTYSQLGDGTTAPHTAPAQVCAPGTTAPCAAFLAGASAIAAGSFHSFALKADGKLWAWGYNLSGQLGNGASGTDSPIPVQVSGY